MDYSELAIQMAQNLQLIHKSGQQKKMNESMQGGTYILQYLLQRKEALFPSEISSAMSISTARIAAALNNLESKGFISREINKDDRRQILVTLTPEGKKIAENQQKEFMENMTQMLQDLGEHDANEFVRIIKKIADLHKN